MKKELNTGAFAAIIAVVVLLVAIIGWKVIAGGAAGKGDKQNQTDPNQFAEHMKGINGGSANMMKGPGAQGGAGGSMGSMGGRPMSGGSMGSMGGSSSGR